MARLLIIDDHEDAAESLALVARMLGHQALAVTRPAQSVGTAIEFVPDLVLCDLNMPDISGFEVARRVRAETRLADVLLIACTGFDIPPFRERAALAGFDDLVPKPMTAEHLVTLLRRADARRSGSATTGTASG